MSAILTQEEIDTKWPQRMISRGPARYAYECAACGAQSGEKDESEPQHLTSCVRVYALAVAEEVLRLRAEQARLLARVVCLLRAEQARLLARVVCRHCWEAGRLSDYDFLFVSGEAMNTATRECVCKGSGKPEAL